MKLNLASVALAALSLPAVVYAQDSLAVATQNGYPNTFSSGSANVSPFTQESKRFNDWSISVGGGVPLMQSADLTSMVRISSDILLTSVLTKPLPMLSD